MRTGQQLSISYHKKCLNTVCFSITWTVATELQNAEQLHLKGLNVSYLHDNTQQHSQITVKSNSTATLNKSSCRHIQSKATLIMEQWSQKESLLKKLQWKSFKYSSHYPQNSRSKTFLHIPPKTTSYFLHITLYNFKALYK